MTATDRELEAYGEAILKAVGHRAGKLITRAGGNSVAPDLALTLLAEAIDSVRSDQRSAIDEQASAARQEPQARERREAEEAPKLSRRQSSDSREEIFEAESRISQEDDEVQSTVRRVIRILWRRI